MTFSSSSSNQNIVGTVQSLLNPYSKVDLNVTVGFFVGCSVSSENPIVTTFTQFQPGIFSSITMSSNSNTIGQQNCVLTLKFSPVTVLKPTGMIEFKVPYWFQTSSTTTNFYYMLDSGRNSVVQSSTSSFSIVGTGFLAPSTGTYSFAYQTSGADIAAGTQITLTFSNFRNPVNSNPVSGFYLNILDNNGNLVDTSTSPFTFGAVTGSATITATNSNPVQIMIDGTTTTNYQVAQTGRLIYFAFTVNVPLEQNCYVKITFPSQIKIDIDETLVGFIGEGFMKGSGSLNDGTASKKAYSISTDSNSITFPSCTDTTQLGLIRQPGIVRMSRIVSPSQVSTVSSFSIQITKDLAATQIIATGTINPTFTMVSNTATLVSFTPFDDNTVQSFTSYNISFTLVSNLYSDSVIEIDLPSGLNTSSTSSVSIVSATNIRSDATITATSSRLTISNCFFDSSNYGFDSSIAGNTISVIVSGFINPYAETAAGSWALRTKNLVSSSYYIVDQGTATSSFTPVRGTSLAPSTTGGITVTNPTTYATTTYQFTIDIQKYVTQNSKVVITMPSDVLVGSVSCQQQTSSGNNLTSSCSASGQTVTLNVRSTVSSDTSLIVMISNIRNPRTFAETDEFSIKTTDSSGNVIEEGAGFTTSMTTMGQMSSFAVTLGNTTNGAKTTYSFKLTSTIPFQNSDILQFTFPSEVLLTSTSKCQRGNTVIACTISGQSISISGIVASTATTAEFVVTNVQNPPSTRTSSTFSSIKTVFVDTDGSQYNSQQFTTSAVTIKTSQAANILTYNLTQDTLDFNASTRYQIKFTPSNKISSTGSIKLQWPTHVTIYSNVSCIITTYKTFTGNCEVNTQTRQITFKNVFSSVFSSQIIIELNPVQNPPDNKAVANGGFIINTYDDSDQLLIIDTLADNILKPNFTCDFPCETCLSNNRTDCLSCFSNIGLNYLMTYSGKGTCKETCDIGYTSNGDKTKRKCVLCDESCTRCQDNQEVGDKFKCITCAPDYIFRYPPLSRCFKSCDNGFFQQNASLCGICSSPCSKCSGSATQCTQCVANSSTPNLLNNICVNQCPAGYLSFSGQCQKCSEPCFTCQDSLSKCTSCNPNSAKKYSFGFQCMESCPDGTTVNNNQNTCEGCMAGCSICDEKDQSLCVKCASGLLLHESSCVNTCPEGFKPNFMNTECVSLISLPLIYFPHLIACFIMLLIVIGGFIKDRKSIILTNIIVFWGPIEFISFLVQTGYCFILSTYQFAAFSFIGFFVYVLINIAYLIYFILRIEKRDQEFKIWRQNHKRTTRIIQVLSAIFSYKLNKLFYSNLFGYDNFKATFSNNSVMQKSMIYFTIAHILVCNGLILVFDFSAYSYFKWGSQLYINMIETAMLSIILIILEVVEFFFIKKYLKDEMSYFQVNHDSVMNVSDFPSDPNIDKKLREETLKSIMSKVKGNQDLFLNNKLDDLFSKFGDRRCNSMILWETDKEEDPRKTRSEPVSPGSHPEFKFDREAHLRDNVYAESILPNPVAKVGKEFSDADTQVKVSDYDKLLSRKGGDFVTFDTEGRQRKDKKIKKRGRKNQYYTQIDAEDDEEVENNLDDIDGDRGNDDDLDIIKEEDDENDAHNLQLTVKMNELKQKEEEALRKQQEDEAKALEEKQRQEQLLKEQQQRELEERLIKEQEEERRKKEEIRLKEEEEKQRQLEQQRQQIEEIAEEMNQQINSDTISIGLNNQVLIEDSLHDFNKMLNAETPLVQVPPDHQSRTFNENDIFGDFDRDEKGNVIVLQDDLGNFIDKQNRRVNERGYLIDKDSGNIIENATQQKMFDHEDIDERGEIPAPFCLEKYNFNPFSIKGNFNYDKSGKPVIQLNKQKELVDKNGHKVNKGGWLIDEQGNIIDQHGRKKFDRKQLINDGQDLPKLFNYNGRRFDINEITGVFEKDPNTGNIIFRKNKSGLAIDNQGRIVNEKGYLIDPQGNVVNREGKKIFEKKHLKNGEIPKIMPFTKFKLKNVQGNFEMDPLGNPILDKNSQGQLIDRDGKVVNQRGYLINGQGDVIDKNGKLMFEKQLLDEEGDIPKVFRTGLLKSDTASSLSRLMSEIEKTQPFEEISQHLMNTELQKYKQNQTQQLVRRDSNGTSLDSMMEDTPSNYNEVNQRFDPGASQRIRAQTQNAVSHRRASQIDEEDDDSQDDDDENRGNDQMKKKRRKNKKKVVYKDPSDKDRDLAKAYGGMARGSVKRIMPKAGISNRIQTAQQDARLQKVASSIAGYSKDQNQNGTLSRDRLEEAKRDFSRDPNQTYQSFLGGSNEPSIMAVPEHHIREQRLKQKKMNELKKKNKLVSKKKNQGGLGIDADFEKMFGKDIDEFLEDSDWDIESFGKMSNFSKGTAKSALGDGRIRGLESIYLQRIETSLKKGAKPPKQVGKKPAFRVMQDRFLDDVDQLNEPTRNEFSSGISRHQSRNLQLRQIDSANTTAMIGQRSENTFPKGLHKFNL